MPESRAIAGSRCASLRFWPASEPIKAVEVFDVGYLTIRCGMVAFGRILNG